MPVLGFAGPGPPAVIWGLCKASFISPAVGKTCGSAGRRLLADGQARFETPKGMETDCLGICRRGHMAPERPNASRRLLVGCNATAGQSRWVKLAAARQFGPKSPQSYRVNPQAELLLVPGCFSCGLAQPHARSGSVLCLPWPENFRSRHQLRGRSAPALRDYYYFKIRKMHHNGIIIPLQP